MSGPREESKEIAAREREHVLEYLLLLNHRIIAIQEAQTELMNKLDALMKQVKDNK